LKDDQFFDKIFHSFIDLIRINLKIFVV
jgi:hypothetical protein